MDANISGILGEGEQVVWQGKMNSKMVIVSHFIAFVIILAIGFMFFNLDTINYTSENGVPGQVSGKLVGGIVWLVGMFFVATSYIGDIVTNYAITKKRIIIKSGLIGTDFKSIYFDQIKNIIVQVGLLGKIFGTGSVKIDTGKVEISSSGGSNGNSGHVSSKIVYDVLKNIDSPYDVYKITQESLEGRKESLYSGRADQESVDGVRK